MKTLTPSQIAQLVTRCGGPDRFLERLGDRMEADFRRWPEFRRSPRHATHWPHGVIELMPWADDHYYSFKYVNGHPGNPAKGRLSVTAIGVLADVSDGYPLMISEMTLLTAFRTAATTLLGARHLARSESHTLAMIGTGAQAEFQLIASRLALPIEQLRFHDRDEAAIEKFQRNVTRLAPELKLTACTSPSEAIEGSDMIITATAAKQQVQLLPPERVPAGCHIHGLGGDCPGKTELAPELLRRCKLVVEYLDQCRIEGEIQQDASIPVHGELWQLLRGEIPGRESDSEITLFDSVGIGLQDYSVLRLTYELAREFGIGEELELIPSLSDPKDLFSLLA